MIQLAEPLIPIKRQRFDDPEAVELAARMVVECLRHGAAAVVEELRLLAHRKGVTAFRFTPLRDNRAFT